MKKTLLLFAATTLLVSCAKTIDINDKEKTSPEVTPSNVELKLNTIASPTKAIAEGTVVPTDNEIRFYPRFFSDISSTDYSSYNDIFNFGYDAERRVWRNYKGRIFEDNPLNPFRYDFTPLYWPAGERVFMDYVACSFSNYVYSRNRGDNEVLVVDPVKKNANRMDVNYKYSYLTRPFASWLLLTREELREMVNQFYVMHQLGYISNEEYQPLYEKYWSPTPSIMDKYDEAVKLAQGEITIDDDYIALPVEERKLEGDSATEIQADAANTLNFAYWFFMNYAPRIYRFMQDDLLYSHDRSLKDSNHGEVKAVFNHSKAWVKVIVNNQTANDLFISGIWFDDVRSDGTLVIDNSKSSFEAYWDFPAKESVTGATIDAYAETSLDGPSVNVTPAHVDILQAKAAHRSMTQSIDGMLPDQYIIPQGCYGPALAVDKIQAGEGAPIKLLSCTYLSGSQRFDLGETACRTMVGNLGGMMFPAQEPGMITLRYTFWKKYLPQSTNPNGTVLSHLPMDQAVAQFDTFLPSDSREISLNLPRQAWDMGKVYVYVLTIAENEITINPYVTEWEYADPIFYPEEGDIPSPEENGQNESFAGNIQDPDWWK